MINYILSGIIIGILAVASRYIIKAKQNGVACIGCASAKTCASACHGCKDANQVKEDLRHMIKVD